MLLAYPFDLKTDEEFQRLMQLSTMGGVQWKRNSDPYKFCFHFVITIKTDVTIMSDTMSLAYTPDFEANGELQRLIRLRTEVELDGKGIAILWMINMMLLTRI